MSRAPKPSRRRESAARGRARDATPARTRPPAPRVLVVAIAAAFALRVAATWLPIPGDWGLDTLRHWPAGWGMLLIAFGAIGFVPAVARRIEAALDGIGAAADRWTWAVDLIVALVVGLIVDRLVDSVRFVGDSTTRFTQPLVDATSAKVFPQAMPLERWVNVDLPRTIIHAGLDRIEVLQALGGVMAFTFALVALACVRALGARRGVWPVAALLVLGSGAVVHFSGYDKFGPLLLGIALATWGAVSLARTGRGAVALGLGAALVVLAHRAGVVLLPSVALVLVQAWRAAASKPERVLLGVAAGLVVAACVVSLPHALDTAFHYDRRVHWGEKWTPRDAWTRLADAFQTLSFLLPLWPAAAVAAWLAGRLPPGEDQRFRLAPLAWLAAATAAVWLVAVRGTQGVARDWDVHAAEAVIFSLIGAGALAAVARRGLGGALAPLWTTGLACTIALWGLHANEEIALRRIDALLQQRTLWDDGGRARAHDLLGMRFLNLFQFDDAVHELRAAIDAAPNPRYFSELGTALRYGGQPEEGRKMFEEARRRDPKTPDPLVCLAALEAANGRYREALAYADTALALAPWRSDAKAYRDHALGVLAADSVAAARARP